jgi:hypothetical protein
METLPHMMARTDDPDTSHAAARSIDASALEALVLETIARFPDGCIADDVKAANPQHRRTTLNPRFAPLLRSGAIVDTGERRIAASGRSQRVVKFVPGPERVAVGRKRKRNQQPLDRKYVFEIWHLLANKSTSVGELVYDFARTIEMAHGIVEQK